MWVKFQQFNFIDEHFNSFQMADKEVIRLKTYFANLPCGSSHWVFSIWIFFSSKYFLGSNFKQHISLLLKNYSNFCHFWWKSHRGWNPQPLFHKKKGFIFYSQTNLQTPKYSLGFLRLKINPNDIDAYLTTLGIQLSTWVNFVEIVL